MIRNFTNTRISYVEFVNRIYEPHVACISNSRAKIMPLQTKLQNELWKNFYNIEILILQQMRNIFPKCEVSPLVTYSMPNDFVNLSCVIFRVR